jgi:hypothetical protein
VGGASRAHAQRAYASANIAGGAAAQPVLDAIWSGRLPATFTGRYVQRANLLGFTNSEDVKNALDLLVDYHWLTVKRATPGPQGGRPTEVYSLSSHSRAQDIRRKGV